MTTLRRRPRALAIAPSTYGIGFAVLEGPTRLIDRGIRFGKQDKNTTCIACVEELILTHDPDILIIEDYASPGSRRRKRIRSLLRMIARRSDRAGLWTYAYSRGQIRGCFAKQNVRTKYEIARVIARAFSMLKLELPAKRRAWMSEHPNMAIFDAVALALTHYDARKQ